jgi:hypothetical protein
VIRDRKARVVLKARQVQVAQVVRKEIKEVKAQVAQVVRKGFKDNLLYLEEA